MPSYTIEALNSRGERVTASIENEHQIIKLPITAYNQGSGNGDGTVIGELTLAVAESRIVAIDVLHEGAYVSGGLPGIIFVVDDMRGSAGPSATGCAFPSVERSLGAPNSIPAFSLTASMEATGTVMAIGSESQSTDDIARAAYKEAARVLNYLTKFTGIGPGCWDSNCSTTYTEAPDIAVGYQDGLSGVIKGEKTNKLVISVSTSCAPFSLASSEIAHHIFAPKDRESAQLEWSVTTEKESMMDLFHELTGEGDNTLRGAMSVVVAL